MSTEAAFEPGWPGSKACAFNILAYHMWLCKSKLVKIQEIKNKVPLSCWPHFKWVTGLDGADRTFPWSQKVLQDCAGYSVLTQTPTISLSATCISSWFSAQKQLPEYSSLV